MSESNPHSSAQKRILICNTALSAYLEDKVQMGIRQFALNRPDWKIGYLHAVEADETHIRDMLSWKPEGILVVARPSRVPKLFELQDIPTVVVDLYHEQRSDVSRVEVDDEAIGSRAAGYFLQNRFEHFGVVLWPGNPPFSRLREEGFARELTTQKFHSHRFELAHTAMQPWYRNPELEEWLRSLPKPAGVYCVNDVSAMRIMEQCDRLGIRIPGEVSVLGTDNNEIFCESIRPYMSSVPQPLEKVGFRAATLLDEHMGLRDTGKDLPLSQELVEPGEVVERHSTSLRALSDPAIAKAANYLRDHAFADGNIADAARVAGLNRRALERGFQQHLDTTPGGYLREVKLDHAKQLLAKTDLRMWEIAEACSMSQEHFASFFRKSTGSTPSAYRRKKHGAFHK
jgi:LacI family transcriptional regulator